MNLNIYKVEYRVPEGENTYRKEFQLVTAYSVGQAKRAIEIAEVGAYQIEVKMVMTIG